MASSLPATWLYQDVGLRGLVPVDGLLVGKSCFQHFQTSSVCSFPAGRVQVNIGLNGNPSEKRDCLVYPVKCEKKGRRPFDPSSVEQPPYDVYYDSTSGQLEPASGARAYIPGKEYWPEGTASRVRAARAPPPTGESEGEPSFGKNPGSRRKMNRTQAKADSDSLEQPSVESFDPEALEMSDDVSEEPKDILSDYVVYQNEPEEKELADFDLDKKLGRPHPFIDPRVRNPVEERLPNEELWWHWRKPEGGSWSRWQKRKPDVETAFLKAMAETGQIKLYGDIPTITECTLYRARRHIFKEERLQAEEESRQRIGPIAYYSEWVAAWKRDTSREAVQKHFEETGEDENTQLLTMFQCQTDREYRIMIGTDIRTQRDPLAMRMREDQIKEIWGGDPVYPTVNYIQDPNEKADWRHPDLHEPTPSMQSYLLEHKKMITREELAELLAKEKTQDQELGDMDEAMARAVDIGEDEGEDGEAETEHQVDEKITRNWSVLKSTPELRKSKDNTPKKEHYTLEEAVDDSENITDFLLDFDEEEE